MPVSDFEIRWGSGFENPQDRVLAKRMMSSAAEAALEGVYEFGLELATRPRIVLHNTLDPQQVFGSATTARTVHVYMGAKLFQSKRQQDMWYTATLFHEFFHCKRMELYKTDSLFEMAVTEGLAYNAERMFRLEKFPWYRAKGAVARVSELPADTIGALSRDFVERFSDESHEGPESDAEWLHAPFRYKLGKAEVIGVYLVHGMLDLGANFKDLIELPAASVLEMATQHG